ncbi:phage major capsid protein, partial [Candidatus Woesearchaeota archaeon]
AEAWAKAEDQTILVGKTADGYPWDGILYNSNTPPVTMSSGKTSFSDVTLDNLYDLIDKVPAEVEDGSVFILHKNILTYLRKLKDNEGRYILDPRNKTLLGYPYYTSSVMPSSSDSAANTPFILFGNFSYVQIGVLQEMATDLLKEGTVNVGGTDISLAQKDMFGVRVVGMWGWVYLPNAFAALKTAAS